MKRGVSGPEWSSFTEKSRVHLIGRSPPPLIPPFFFTVLLSLSTTLHKAAKIVSRIYGANMSRTYGTNQNRPCVFSNTISTNASFQLIPALLQPSHTGLSAEYRAPRTSILQFMGRISAHPPCIRCPAHSLGAACSVRADALPQK